MLMHAWDKGNASYACSNLFDTGVCPYPPVGTYHAAAPGSQQLAGYLYGAPLFHGR
jgi:hypothetical protein